MNETIHWAHVDALGNIVAWGTSSGTDVFLQQLEPGLTAVARPQEISGYGGWKYINNQWVDPKETSQ